MTQDFSIINLLLNASWVVQAVVATLLMVSIASWTAIFRKIIASGKLNPTVAIIIAIAVVAVVAVVRAGVARRRRRSRRR